MSDHHHHAAIFSLEGVCFSYGRSGAVRQVLCDVDFSLQPGQRIGLYGPNGSGKTTLFRCITGLARPQSGQVLFHDGALRFTHAISPGLPRRTLRYSYGRYIAPRHSGGPPQCGQVHPVQQAYPQQPGHHP